MLNASGHGFGATVPQLYRNEATQEQLEIRTVL